MIEQMNKRLLGAACGAALLFGAVMPASAQSFSEALAMAYQTNPVLKAQRAEVDATGEFAVQARASLLPTVNAAASIVSNDGRYTPDEQIQTIPEGPLGDLFTSFAGSGPDTTNTVGVEINQPLFQGGRNLSALKEASANLSAAEAGLLAREQQILAAAAAAYLSVLTQQESVKASEKSVQSVGQQREAAKIRFDVGQATKTDIAQAEARYARAEAQLLMAQSQLVAARQQFERVIGQPPMGVASDIAALELPETLDLMLGEARQQSPTILMAQAQLKAADYQVKKAKGFLAPNISAKATYGYVENQFLDGDRSERSTLGLEMQVPLFQGGRTMSAIRQAKDVREARRYALVDAERQVEEQARVAWQNMIAAEAGVLAAEKATAASALALEGLKLENEVGRRTTLDVLNGEAEFLAAQLSFYQAREQFYLSQFGVLQSMGKLTASQLGL